MSLWTLVDGGAGELVAHRALKIGLHLCFQLLMVLTLSALCMVSDRGDCCGDRGGGGVDISRHAQLMLQVSDPHEGDCGGDCGGDAC